MGTAVERAVSVSRLAEDKASGYNMKGYTFNGMDFFACYKGFEHVYQEVLATSRPVLVEVITERFKGHSISDPAHYRTKEQLKAIMERDPIANLEYTLLQAGIMTEAEIKELEKKMREKVIAAIEFADKSAWPDPQTLEEDVFAS